MSAIDLLILVVFIASVFFGISRGIIRQLGSVGGIVAGIIACRLFTPLISDALLTDGEASSASDIYVNNVVVNIAIFILAYFGVKYLCIILHKVVKTLHLTPIDRIAGAIFSLFEWMLGLSLLFNLINILIPSYNLPDKSKLSDGRAVRAVMDLAPDILGGIGVSELPDFALNDKDLQNVNSKENTSNE